VGSDQQLQLQATVQRQEEQPVIEKIPEPQEGKVEIQSNGQNQESQQVQDSASEATPELEVQLRQNRLLIERLDSERLKVNLSSDGLFDFDSAEIKNGAHPALDRLVDVLRKHDDLMVQIVGHTDSSGVAEYNLHLSQLRARAVAEYLVDQGLTGSSIRSEGRGDRDTRLEQPDSDNPRLKRRVEIYISRVEQN
jgi:outer membrane protein OmpA-like peptidoglycan-associated protein